MDEARNTSHFSPFDKELGRALIGSDQEQVNLEKVEFTARAKEGLASLTHGPWPTDLIPETVTTSWSMYGV